MSDKLLTPHQVAERLQIKIRTVYKYLSTGGPLHHLRIDVGPGTVRVHPEGFEKYLKQGTQQNDLS